MTNPMTNPTLTGYEAIEAAQNDASIKLRKYADPIDDARGVTIDEAIEIANEDPSLIYCEDHPRYSHVLIDGDDVFAVYHGVRLD